MSSASTRGVSPPPDQTLLDHAAAHRTTANSGWSWAAFQEAHRLRKWRWDKYRKVARRESPLALNIRGQEPTTPSYIDPDAVTVLADDEPPERQTRVKLVVSFTNGICAPYSPVLSADTLRIIHELFGTVWFQNYYPSQMLTTLWQGHIGSENKTQVFLCSTGFGTVYPITTITAYDPDNDNTKSIIISDLGAFDHFALLGVVSQVQQNPHPLLLQVLAVERSLEFLICDLEYLNNHTVVEHVKLDKDYAEKVAAYRAWWGGWENRRFMAKETAEYILCRLENIEQWLPGDRVAQYRDTTELMKARLNQAVASCRSAEVFGQVISNRLSAWQDAAFAAQSDNSMMKFLALLGTVYLPATFVSSFFAMPVFDWHASSISEMTGRHFWIWWAVMIPLSVVTLATVILWGRLGAKKARIITRFTGSESEESV
ncbi:hypothetical protein V8F20_009416 [Naviculisporaceae sp. PSN 640]